MQQVILGGNIDEGQDKGVKEQIKMRVHYGLLLFLLSLHLLRRQ